MSNKTCLICSKMFTPAKGNQKYCTFCSKHRFKDIQKLRVKTREEQLKLTASPKTQKRKKYFRSIRQVVADLEAYNKQHGTALTYGQYVSLCDTGKIHG